MITVTNDKIAGFEPRWAEFRGFSLLFENSGAGVTRSGDLAYLAGEIDADPALQLYKALREGLAALGRDTLMNAYLFCALPPASYHVTVWDGVNDGNVARVTAVHRPACEHFLASLPGALCQPHLFADVETSPLMAHPPWDIRFSFDGLATWSNVSLVAQLAPADEASRRALDGLRDLRGHLSAAFDQRFGVRPQKSYVPHVTLGYFANQEWGERASSCLKQWDRVVRERTAGLTLQAGRVRLYGFTNMVTFFRRAEADDPETRPLPERGPAAIAARRAAPDARWEATLAEVTDSHLRETLQRLAAIDREQPSLDKARAEAALAQYLVQVGLASRPVRWVQDAEQGYLAALRADWSPAMDAKWDPRKSDITDSEYWTRKGVAPVSVAFEALHEALRSAKAFGSAADKAVDSWNSAELAAELAARSAGAKAAYRNPRKVYWIGGRDAWERTKSTVQSDQRALKCWQPISLAFLEAAEAGLWLFWVTKHEVLAVPRPVMRLSGERLHCADGPAVYWPGGASYYFYRGVQVPAE